MRDHINTCIHLITSSEQRQNDIRECGTLIITPTIYQYLLIYAVIVTRVIAAFGGDDDEPSGAQLYFQVLYQIFVRTISDWNRLKRESCLIKAVSRIVIRRKARLVGAVDRRVGVMTTEAEQERVLKCVGHSVSPVSTLAVRPSGSYDPRELAGWLAGRRYNQRVHWRSHSLRLMPTAASYRPLTRLSSVDR